MDSSRMLLMIHGALHEDDERRANEWRRTHPPAEAAPPSDARARLLAWRTFTKLRAIRRLLLPA